MSTKNNKRVWLNPSSSYHTGYIIYGVVRDEEDASYSATFKIADCSRIVSLNIDIYTKKDRKLSIKKLQLIISGAQETLDGIKEIDNK